jgi:hypothetical protein
VGDVALYDLGISLHGVFPCLRDFLICGISLCKGFPFISGFLVNAVSLYILYVTCPCIGDPPCNGFPSIDFPVCRTDFPVQGDSSYQAFPCTMDFGLLVLDLLVRIWDFNV